MTTSQMIGTAATVYGFAASLTVLLQARQLLQRGSSCDVSGRFLASYVGGYGIWLAYGLSTQSVPIVVVHAVGLVAGIVTLAVALHLRGSLLRPASWNSCDGDPAPSSAGTEPVPSPALAPPCGIIPVGIERTIGSES